MEMEIENEQGVGVGHSGSRRGSARAVVRARCQTEVEKKVKPG
jgi:hypothetical protein